MKPKEKAAIKTFKKHYLPEIEDKLKSPDGAKWLNIFSDVLSLKNPWNNKNLNIWKPIFKTVQIIYTSRKELKDTLIKNKIYVTSEKDVIKEKNKRYNSRHEKYKPDVDLCAFDALFHQNLFFDCEKYFNKPINLVTISPHTINLKEKEGEKYIFYKDLVREANALGLYELPTAIAPYLRMNYLEQPLDETLIFSMINPLKPSCNSATNKCAYFFTIGHTKKLGLYINTMPRSRDVYNRIIIDKDDTFIFERK